jgi:hypothetical protein
MSSSFLSNENLNLIWGVISENGDNIGSDLDKYKFFQENVGMFYKENKSITNLLVLNKKYIVYILDKFNNMSVTNRNPIPVTSNETFETIQQAKMESFNRELKIKQDEFTDVIKLKVPPKPVFEDEAYVNENKLTYEQLVEERKANLLPKPIPIINTLNTRRSVIINQDEINEELDIVDLSRFQRTSSPILPAYRNLPGQGEELNANGKRITWGQATDVYPDADTETPLSVDNVFEKFKRKPSVQKEAYDNDILTEIRAMQTTLLEKMDQLMKTLESTKQQTYE